MNQIEARKYQLERDRALRTAKDVKAGALRQGNRKPYNIYQEGTPTARAQGRQGELYNTLMGHAATAADRMTGPLTAPVVAAANAVKKVAAPVVGRLAKDWRNQRNTVQDTLLGQDVADNRTLPGDREANARIIGDGERRVGGNAPVLPPALPAEPTVSERSLVASAQASPETEVRPEQAIDVDQMLMSAHSPEQSRAGGGNPSETKATDLPGMTVHLSDRDKQLKQNLDKINEMLLSGVTPTADQQERIDRLRQQAGFMRGGTDRVPVGRDGLPLPQSAGGPPGNKQTAGNLDVTFDDSVDQAARSRFMEDPVRPTAQIDRYNAANRDNGGMTQGQAASMNADRILSGGGRSIKDSLLSQENIPDIPGLTKAQNAQLRKDRVIRSGRENRETLEKMMLEEGINARHAKDMGLKQQDRTLNADLLRDKNQLERDKLTVDSRTSAAQTKNFETDTAAKEYGLAQADRLNKMQQEYLSPDTSAERKKELAGQLRTIAGKDQPKYQIASSEDIDPKTSMPIKKVYAVNPDDPASSIEIGGGKQISAAPQSAVDHLKKNPGLAEKFKKKYGYLPDVY
jgi:hypothetical protein